jgi:ribonucleotide monophosphatase NagD (HAD superfamily)
LLLQEAMRSLGSSPAQTVMVGDGLDIDILAGKAAGTRTLFVLSGKDTRETLEQVSITPDYVYENLAAVVKVVNTGRV